MRVIQKDNYFYLVHSFRRGKRTITKEKYLGKELPKDLQTIQSEFLRNCLEDVFERLNLIQMRFAQEQKKTPESVKQEALLQTTIEFTYNTNAIEGSTITHEETEELVREGIAPHKPMRDIEETRAHAELFKKILDNPPEVSEKKILSWHNELFGKTKPDLAGKYREYGVRVGIYRASDWQDVPKLMNNLIRWISESQLVHPVELAARAHYQFEKIHPFGDGNGRVGRLLMTAILAKAGFPALLIEYKKRQSYYQALQRSEDEFFAYFMRRYLAVFKHYLT